MKIFSGLLEKVFKIIFGLGFLSLLFFTEGGLKFIGFLGIFPLANGFMNSCSLALVRKLKEIKRKL